MPDDPSTARRTGHLVARWTICLLLACLALEAATLASGFSYRGLLPRLAAGVTLLPQEAAAIAARDRVIEVLKLVAFTGAGIAWLVWLHRTYGNLVLVGSKRARFSRGWAVAYWFIPFVNLVRSFQVMKDLWLRSDSLNDRDGYDRLPAPAFLTGWWGASVSWGVLEQVVAYMARDARTPLELINATDMGLLVNAIGLVAGVLAIKVVREIDRRQQCFDVIPAQHPGAATQGGARASAGPQTH
ncbi:MAG TPA: DUF4328 domain-containing protein [Gemmatimonadales bacterium]|nr:DUF4328 domain-containing protein [Gemmatimonadales bacterium]